MKSLWALGLVPIVCAVPLSAPGSSLTDDIRLHVTRNHTDATLSWALPEDNFVLESTADFNSKEWQGVAELITIHEGNCQVRVPLGAGQRYFRLRRREAQATSTSQASVPATANGYITAVLRSECSGAPPPPPPVGQTVVGADYVIRTVARGDPTDYRSAQEVVTDAVFESLMPLYCGLQGKPGSHCVRNSVQWGILTYNADGSPKMSTCAASGCDYHFCAVTNGYIVAVVRGESGFLPPLPPVGQTAVGADAVVMTIADGNPMDLGNAQRLATDAVFESLMRKYCALPRGTGLSNASGRVQWHVATFDVAGNPRLSGCAASGCGFHDCMVTRGFLTAVLRGECASLPPPPPVGQISVGPDYVIMTVADGDPTNYLVAQQIVTDAVFESLMPLYCGLQGRTGSRCVTNRVQWNLATFDAGGNWKISGSPTSGPAFHYCAVTNGYIVAIVRGERFTLPTLPPVGQVAVGSDAVVMTIADGNPMNFDTARRLGTDAVFESLMRQYCALPRGTGPGHVSGRARWEVATFDPDGTLKLSDCAASGCDFHECVVSRGFITAVLRSGCTGAPTPPPPVGGIAIGPDFVMMTVADGDPADYRTAQQFATDAVFESLMPLYCALQGKPGSHCVTNQVQWNLLTYDAGGNPKLSTSPVSGPGYHYLDSCAQTPQERVEQLKVWVNVDLTAGILNRRDGRSLIASLDAARRRLARGNNQNAISRVRRFVSEVDALVKAEQLSAAAAQPLKDGALALIAQLESRARAAQGAKRFRL